MLDGYDIHRDGMKREDGSFDASVIGNADGENKFTGKDMRAMRQQGMTDKEMARQMYDQQEDSTRGKKAQNLLDSYVNEFTNTPPPEDTTEPPGDTTFPVEGTLPALSLIHISEPTRPY